MGLFMKAFGGMTRQMEREDLYMQIEISMREIGSMIRQMDTAYTTIQMALNMKAFGRKTSNMASERKPGLMAHSTKETTK